MAKLTLVDIAAGYVLVATINANNALIETALEKTLSRDGSTPNTMSANLDINSNKITNLLDGTNNQDAITLAQLNAASIVALTAAASAVTLADAGGKYVSTTVEAAFAELASVASGEGASIIGLEDSAGNLAATDVEAAITEMYVDFLQLAGVKTWPAAQTFDDNIFILESASADADVAGDGQFWVKSDSPNAPYFTDDAGGDQVLDPSVSLINEQNGNYTLILGDKGKTISKVSGGSGETYTIPANASVAFPLGTIIKMNNDGGGTLSVAITSDTLTWAKDNTTGTRTLADGGDLIVQKVTSTAWKCAGSQVT